MSTIEGTWVNKIHDADAYYKKWESRYKCNLLQDYYRGFHWKNKITNVNTLNYNPYTINLIYATIKMKVSTFLFQKPSYIVTARPTTYWDQDLATISSGIKQDALNAIVSNRNLKFKQHVKRAATDSFFRFGLLEVGYSADWRNPNKVRPLLKSDRDDEVDFEDDRILDKNDLPQSERIYIKRIKPNRFRTCVTDELELDEMDWFGYFEYYNKRVLLKTKGIKYPDNEVRDGGLSSMDVNSVVGDTEKFEDKEWLQLAQRQEIVKCWHIWSPVEKKQYLILDSGGWVLWESDYERNPLIDIRWDEDSDHWYPVPPVFQWLSSQDEINEAREQTRSFRRRFTRKFQAVEGRIDEEEKEKFVSGPDGIVITVKQQDAITPIQNPEEGVSKESALAVAKDDFNIITGTSAEVRDQNDRETATQARLMDQRAQIRENSDQMDFGVFMCDVGREILLTAGERLTQDLWVKYSNTDSEDPSGWRLISSSSLSDGFDFDIELDIINATPAAMAAQQASFMQFISIVQQYPLIQLSPALIREAAYRSGYRNEKIIQQMQQAAINQLKAQAQGLMNQNGQNPASQANQTLANQMQSPSPAVIDKQVTQQLM